MATVFPPRPFWHIGQAMPTLSEVLMVLPGGVDTSLTISTRFTEEQDVSRRLDGCCHHGVANHHRLRTASRMRFNRFWTDADGAGIAVD